MSADKGWEGLYDGVTFICQVCEGEPVYRPSEVCQDCINEVGV